jgi:cobaltochelatase CobS
LRKSKAYSPPTVAEVAAAIRTADFTERRKALRALVTALIATNPTVETQSSQCIDEVRKAGVPAAKATVSYIRDSLNEDVLLGLLAWGIEDIWRVLNVELSTGSTVTFLDVSLAIRDPSHCVPGRTGYPVHLAKQLSTIRRVIEDLATRGPTTPASGGSTAKTSKSAKDEDDMTTTDTTKLEALQKAMEEYKGLTAKGTHHEAALSAIASIYGSEIEAAVREIATAAAGGSASKTEAAPNTATAFPNITKLATAKIDPAIAPALDMMLDRATSGALKSLADVIADLGKVDGVLKATTALQSEVSTLRDQISKGSFTTTLYEFKPTSVGSFTIPSGRQVRVHAGKLFGNRSKVLDFEVTAFEWDGPHPFVNDPDPDYEVDPNTVAAVLYALETNQKGWFWGDTGTGKTSVIAYVLARLRWPMIRVNFDSEITRLDLIGREVLRSDGKGGTKSEWVDGVLPQAMKIGAALCGDEMDAIKPDVSYVFQRVLEKDGELLITENAGELVKAHPAFRIFATANTVGQGDETGMYPAVRAQSQAMLDRYTVWKRIDYLTKAQETKMLLKRFPTLKPDMADKLAQLGVEIRTAFRNGDIMQTLSPRGLMGIAAAFLRFDNIDLALDMTVIGKASNNDRSAIKGISQRVFGGKAAA